MACPLFFGALGPLVGYTSYMALLLPWFAYHDSQTTGALSEEITVLAKMIPAAYLIGAIPAMLTGAAYGLVGVAVPTLFTPPRRRVLVAAVLGFSITLVYSEAITLSSPLSFGLLAGLPAAVVCSLLLRIRLPES